MRFEIVLPGSPLRPAVEAMVRNVFFTEYGARIAGFPERMIVVLDAAGEPRCAAALRDAKTGFFSEQYLDQPLEQAISAASGREIARDAVLELGSVAANRPGALLMLLRGFAHVGLESGYRWGVFTATDRLRRLAQRFSIAIADLGPASASRIANPQDWGRYYDHDPRVCAVEGLPAEERLDVMRLPSTPQDVLAGAQV
ncbi:MAG: thermostable hemolysin [Ferrovibrio sp.]